MFSYIIYALIFAILIWSIFVFIVLIREKLAEKNSNSIDSTVNPLNIAPKKSAPQSNNSHQPNIEDFDKRKSLIISQLNQTKQDFQDVNIAGSNQLVSTIDNIFSYLTEIQASEAYLLDTIEKDLYRIDLSRPEGDPTDKVNKITAELLSIFNLLNYYNLANKAYSSDIKNFYESALSELSDELKKFRKLKEIIANSSTIKVYENAQRKYSFAFYIYLTAFFTAIYAALHFSLYIIQKKKIYIKSFGMDTYDYWTIKISAIFIFITVITFLIKQATHYQKKKDEAERTMLELKALPSYLADLEAKDATNLRKDLASKYFGKSNDNSTLNEIGNIIGEQLKNSTEVAKSSAEVIKALTPPKN